ncbi:Pentatricopeptide repeat-containing protein [Cardamine amara subsp. amara]|uniref:Pentatricopeptide repeat-containing protein n=1 Tax=Cardamine amara subsp. amara TaxID=228776 RepID=A0ABD0YZ39_CARAN
MIRRSVDPNIFTYNSLINGLCMHNRLDEAKQMFEFMVSKDCLPDVVAYNTLINGFCKSKSRGRYGTLQRNVSKRIGWRYNHLHHSDPRVISSRRL